MDLAKYRIDNQRINVERTMFQYLKNITQTELFIKLELFRAFNGNNSKKVKELLDKNADANCSFPIYFKLYHKNYIVMPFASIFFDRLYPRCFTPLHFALRYCDLDVVKELIKHGAGVNEIHCKFKYNHCIDKQSFVKYTTMELVLKRFKMGGRRCSSISDDRAFLLNSVKLLIENGFDITLTANSRHLGTPNALEEIKNAVSSIGRSHTYYSYTKVFEKIFKQDLQKKLSIIEEMKNNPDNDFFTKKPRSVPSLLAQPAMILSNSRYSLVTDDIRFGIPMLCAQISDATLEKMEAIRGAEITYNKISEQVKIYRSFSFNIYDSTNVK